MSKVGTVLDWDAIQDAMYEGLTLAKAEFITEVYNKVCFDDVKYIGDDKWEVIKSDD